MKIIRCKNLMSVISRKLILKGKSIGFVPTMGALHEGHLSLIRQARKDNDIVVVSIFVNPAQFGPKEDFKKYPRNLFLDAALCRNAGVDFIFYPQAKEMYPKDFKTFVEVKELSDILCGATRPGHFRGVATVVTKLFNIVGPSIAYFGQKDAQQVAVIKAMVSDLDLPVKIKVMPTLRENDGLAMSSRNKYLNTAQRAQAQVLYRSLRIAKSLINQGIRDTGKIVRLMKQEIHKVKIAKIDYVSIVDTKNLTPIKEIKKECLMVLAVWIGNTRLIDNMVIIRRMHQ
ncbi:MAG: pantoate--beta-alanine ligase [Candidatus Omnitrophica bacterium]|nr:pantoate--beta-alanine ligase [Candidatus Omnitrophota bacterium]